MRRRLLLLAFALVILGAVAASISIDAVRWRVEVLSLMATGRIDNVRWDQLLRMLMPGSGYYLEPLTRDRNAYGAIENPYASPADRAEGSRLFALVCAACHDPQGHGAAPNLRTAQLKLGESDWGIFRSASGGVPGLGMAPTGLSEKELWQVVAYLRAQRADALSTAESALDFTFPDTITVPYTRLVASAAEPANWLTYSGSYRGWRYSALTQIDEHNVADLKLAWSAQLPTSDPVEGNPIVIDGVMYMTEPSSNVLALDVTTGKTIWRYTRSIRPDVRLCCARANRGVAVLDDKVYVGTLDGFLVALDSRSGREIWSAQVADYRDGYSITVAPLAVRDKIIIGVAGGEFAIRGYVDAYDAATGKLKWRFHTVPDPGTPGAETWQGTSSKTGGGPTWVTGSFDPELGLLYWGVGNPWPDFNGDNRAGDNLYTNSVVALDIETGKLAWHFQFTPHDVHDWDSNQTPMLIDAEMGGATRKLIVSANRNGFYYVLDRATGEFLMAVPFVRQDWATGIDLRGRPILNDAAAPSTLGTLVWPGSGGTNWQPPAYSPLSGLVYVSFTEAPKIFFKAVGKVEDSFANTEYIGGTDIYTGARYNVGLRALDATTGAVRWQHLSARDGGALVAGALATAGNLVFFGYETYFSAFDARDGRELWRVNLGGRITASPTTFEVQGQQLVAIPAGNSLFVFRR
jgi:alcohol dehydrogenase (cytochrome c)